MPMSHARKSTNTMEYVSPANSSNRKWLTNKHLISSIAQSKGNNVDRDHYNYDSDDDDDGKHYYSGYRSIANNGSWKFLSMMDPGDHFRRRSSFASCNAWRFGCPSLVDSRPTSPSPICSPVSSISCSPPSEFNQASSDEMGQQSIKETKIEGSSKKWNFSKLKAVRNDEDENSLATCNYYADDDRLPAALQAPEDETFSSVNSTYGYRECDASDIESAIKDHLEPRRNRFAYKLDTWREDRRMKIMNKLMREEAAIDDWENKTTTKAKMIMREIEVKLENKRERAMQKMQRKIISAQNEAKKKKLHERAVANKKSSRVEETLKKRPAKRGNWFHYVLKTC